MKTTITVDPGGKLDKALKAKIAAVKDLRIPLELIRESWFKGNRAIFALSSAGKYEDLSETYKIEKQAAVGFVYPILQRTGFLRSALTEPGSASSIARVIGKMTLDIGVDEANDVFRWLHFGTKKMPARPLVLLGAEQVAPSTLATRVQIWQKMIIDYVIQVTGAKNG